MRRITRYDAPHLIHGEKHEADSGRPCGLRHVRPHFSFAATRRERRFPPDRAGEQPPAAGCGGSAVRGYGGDAGAVGCRTGGDYRAECGAFSACRTVSRCRAARGAGKADGEHGRRGTRVDGARRRRRAVVIRLS